MKASGVANYLDLWLPWLGATVIAALTMSAFVFGNFETKEDAKEKVHNLERRVESRDVMLEKRLDRIEDKLDLVLKLKR